MCGVKDRVQQIIDEFLVKESSLLLNNASEQSITHRLAVMLEGVFQNWDVDCEYNRDQSTIKKLIYAISPNEGAEERSVVPDIIIHKRMTENNFLVIEVKKSTNHEPDDRDLAKLSAFKEQLGYENALFIRFNTETEIPSVNRQEWV